MKANSKTLEANLNLGGGPYFKSPGWLNLEAVSGEHNPNPFVFSPDCVFPCENRTANLVYSSHCLEHLNTPTVIRVLSETVRVMKDEAVLVLKLPNFDQVMLCWKQGDLSFFDESWNFSSIVHTWKNKNVVDSIDSRAAVIFCSYWNKDYGHPFGNQIMLGEKPYLGPAAIDNMFIRYLLETLSPSQISAALRQLTLLSETEEFSFDHQNAWSANELEALLQQVGLRVVSNDIEDIVSKFSHVPNITEMQQISMYCWAKKDISLTIK
jgi:hypothetical protein